MPVITEGAKDSPTVCDVAVQAYVGSNHCCYIIN